MLIRRLLTKYLQNKVFCMNYHFTLCEDCNREIVKEGNQKLDFSYNERKPTEHNCKADKKKKHPENGINLMQNART